MTLHNGSPSDELHLFCILQQIAIQAYTQVVAAVIC